MSYYAQDPKKDTMKTKQRLEAQAAAIHAKLDKLATARRIRRNRKLIGRCYKYRNIYGPGSDGWWLYIRITGGGYWMTSVSFQHTAEDIYEVKHDHFTTILDGFTEITRTEIDAEWREFLHKLKSLHGLKEGER